MRTTLILAAMAALTIAAKSQTAEQMPQDYWSVSGKEIVTLGGYRGIAIGPDGLAYVGLATDIAVLDDGANILRRWGSFTNLLGIAVNSQNEVYVYDADASPNRIRVYDTNGNLIRAWGVEGTGDGQFTSSSSSGTENSMISISNDDRVCVLDRGAYRVQVFDRMGTFLSKFGSQGELSGQFTSRPRALVALDRGIVVAANKLTLFSYDGAVTSVVNATGSLRNLAATPDQMIIALNSSNSGQLYLYDTELNLVFGSADATISGNSGRMQGLAVKKNGELWMLHNASYVPHRIIVRPRVYLDKDPALNPAGIPQPYVVAVAQRSGTTLVDIDYRVVDADSTAVQTAMVIYTGAPSLSTLLLPATLEESTESKLGVGIATNAVHRVTWNAGVDWDTDIGTIKVEVLAKDERGLFPIHWTTTPGEGGDPDIQISVDPVTNADLYSLWVWLIATKDASVSLVSGQVIGVGGTYDGQTLYDGANTTVNGRAFLLE